MDVCGLIQLLRTACEDGEKAERFREELRRWIQIEGRTKRNKIDEIVESLDSMMG